MLSFCVHKVEIKIKLRSFKSSEHINEKGNRDGPETLFGILEVLLNIQVHCK